MSFRSVVILIIAAATALAASGQRTTRKRLRPTPAETTAATPLAQDTVTGNHALAMVRFSGYEKRLRATRETLFATNLADCDIVVAQFTIDYFDSSGRQLHRRTAATSTPIPAGQTRRIDIESWDRQNSFYSPAEVRPKVAAIPYTIKISDPRIVLNR